MAERRRRHHTVPRFYLEGWGRRGQIGTVELPGKRRFLQSTRDATAITDFYTIHDEDGEPSDAFEQALAEIEADVHPLLRRLIDGGPWPLPAEERETLAWWFALQYLRGPDRRAGMEQIAAVMTKLQIGARGPDSFRKDVSERLGRPISDSDFETLWEQAMGPQGPPIRLAPIGHIGQIAEMLPQIVRYFAGRHWQLLRFTRRSLVTSDSPVTLMPDVRAEDADAIGLLNAWAISVPLSRRVALLMVGPSDEMLEAGPPPLGAADGIIEPSTSYARAINHTTIFGARRWVFHHPEDGDIFDGLDLPEPRIHEFATSTTDFARDLYRSRPSPAGAEDSGSG